MEDRSIQTERLELAVLDDGDVDELTAMFSLEPVRRYLLDGNPPERDWVASLAADSQHDFARRGLGLWIVRRRGAAELVGLVGFRDFYDPPVEELIYALHPDAWGQGIATEMSRAAIDRAFDEAGRERVRASTDAPNEASLAVMRRLGMRETGREPAPEGSVWEQVHCEVTREAWRSRGEG